MIPIDRLRVELGERSYEIFDWHEFLSNAADLLRPLGLSSRGVIISDSNVAGLYAEPLRLALAQGGLQHAGADGASGGGLEIDAPDRAVVRSGCRDWGWTGTPL